MRIRWQYPALALVAALAPAVGLALVNSPVSDAQQNGFQCPARDGQAIVINVGDIDCVTAADFAAQYNPMGDKFQQVGPFNCYFGNAMTQPLLFTCVADDGTEFAVYPA